MTAIEEMFLKAADFRLIVKEKPPLTIIGWRIRTTCGEYGSFCTVDWPITIPLLEEVTMLCKEQALDTVLLLFGCRK